MRVLLNLSVCVRGKLCNDTSASIVNKRKPIMHTLIVGIGTKVMNFKR